MQDAAAPLPSPSPYRNFVMQTLADSHADHGAFFRSLLGDVTEPTAPFGQLALPSGHTPADMREARISLDPALAQRIRGRAGVLGITPASLFHLAWAIVLGHAAGRRDVVFGTVLLGRMKAGAGQGVGMFINTLPVRIQPGAAAASAAARATHHLLAELLLHEYAPLSLAQRASGVAAPAPLFSSLFNFRHSPEEAASATWPGVEMLFAEERTSYPLAMAVDDTGTAFVFTAMTANTLDPHFFCAELEQSITSLTIHLELHPNAPLANLPAVPKAQPHPVPNAPASPAYHPPRTPAELTLQHVWQRILNLPSVGIHDDFFHLGGDSLTAMRLLSAVNAALTLELPMRTLLDFPTIAGMAAGPSVPTTAVSGRLIRLQSGGTRPPLFCIHPAGGYVFCYLPLARELGPDQPLFGVQAAGLEDGEQLPSSIEEAATMYIDTLRQHQPNGPYQLLGMSSGGLIAFEMARQLRVSGAVVSLLAMLDTAVPNPEAEQALSPAILLRAMAAELGCEDLLDTGSAPATLADLVAVALDTGRLPAGFTLAHAERIATVFANIAAIHNRYKPIPTQEPVLLLRALRRFHVSDALPDWSRYTPAGSQVLDLDCGHSDLVSPPWAPEVARILTQALFKSAAVA